MTLSFIAYEMGNLNVFWTCYIFRNKKYKKYHARLLYKIWVSGNCDYCGSSWVVTNGNEKFRY